MTGVHSQDWDPHEQSNQRDQIAAYDAMRQRCPVAFSDYLQWSLFKHDDVMHVLHDHKTFSNAASRHLSVPNAMDPPEHTRFRRLIEPYFGEQAMADFAPTCRAIAERVVARLPQRGEIEAMRDVAQPFALEIQCAFMGWPASLHEPLSAWVNRQQAATLKGDRNELGALATEFDGFIRNLLAIRREAGETAPNDVTTQIMRERIDGRLLSEEEIVSILRNWTVGELGTIAASIGILMRFLAERVDIQTQLREQPALIPAAIDEILRLDAPLISNRRVATCPVTMGGRTIEKGERLTLLWASANRDENVFKDPATFRLDRHPDDNLLYGAGIHVCPGAPLARMELRYFVETLLAETSSMTLSATQPVRRAQYPAGGYSHVPMHVAERE